MNIQEGLQLLRDIIPYQKKKKKNFNLQAALAEVASARSGAKVEIQDPADSERIEAWRVFNILESILKDIQSSALFKASTTFLTLMNPNFSPGDYITFGVGTLSNPNIVIQLRYSREKKTVTISGGQKLAYAFDKFPFSKSFKVNEGNKWEIEVKKTLLSVLEQEKYKERRSTQ